MADSKITAVAPAVTTQTQTTTSAANPYAMAQTSMANDFFGSQIDWNQSIYAAKQPQYNQPKQTAGGVQDVPLFMQNSSYTPASNLLQNYYLNTEEGKALLQQMSPAEQNAVISQNSQSVQTTAPQTTQNNIAQTAPTAQDYMIASQIASQFAGDAILLDTNTTFTNRDFLANQTFNRNPQVQGNLRYTA